MNLGWIQIGDHRIQVVGNLSLPADTIVVRTSMSLSKTANLLRAHYYGYTDDRIAMGEHADPPLPPKQPGWWEQKFTVASEKFVALGSDDVIDWDEITKAYGNIIASSFGVPPELLGKEGGKMKVYFGCVIHNDGENDPSIIIENRFVLARTTTSVHKQLFAEAVLFAPDIAPENLVVYSTELTPTGGT